MFTHVFLGSNDLDRSRAFYDAIMAALGRANILPPELPKLVYPGAGASLIIAPPLDGKPAFGGNGTTIGVAAATQEQVDAWYEAGHARLQLTNALTGNSIR